jgi:hypothetical protein
MFNNMIKTNVTNLFHRVRPSLFQCALIAIVLVGLVYLYDPGFSTDINVYLFYPTSKINDIGKKIGNNRNLAFPLDGLEMEGLFALASKLEHEFENKCIRFEHRVLYTLRIIMIGYPIYRLLEGRTWGAILKYTIFFGACGLFVWQNFKEYFKFWYQMTSLTQDLFTKDIHNRIWYDTVYPIAYEFVCGNTMTTMTITHVIIGNVIRSQFLLSFAYVLIVIIIFVAVFTKITDYKTRFVTFYTSYVPSELPMVDTMEAEAGPDAESDAESE